MYDYYKEVLPDLNVSVYVAPGEAEHQLVRMQMESMITHIVCNDSDYILNGGDNILLVGKGGMACVVFFNVV